MILDVQRTHDGWSSEAQTERIPRTRRQAAEPDRGSRSKNIQSQAQGWDGRWKADHAEVGHPLDHVVVRGQQRIEPEPEERTDIAPLPTRRLEHEPELSTNLVPGTSAERVSESNVPKGLASRVRFETGTWTDIGPRRENQDRGLARPRFLAIADGVGGRSSGAAAARLALATVDDIMSNPHTNPGQAVAAANIALRSQQTDDAIGSGRATTLDIVCLDEADDLAGAHVGDSRVYVLPNDSTELVRLTTDHAYGHRLTRSIGGSNAVSPDVWVYEAAVGDLILLATDGLWKGGFDDQAIGRTMRAGRSRTPQDIARALVETASQHAVDNITVIVARVVPNP
ncbi:PP2C family protein-serine/threonine phosphatase (plasmid) [Gordonia rubripertincta]|uniref:PP2C family protein-serine/threonine phosphatase n=2 Tax=Gordonia TaxID=2053 RepID=UPI0039B5C165